MRLLDRYILKNFLVPFLLCFFGFLSIWLVFDLAGNAQDFIDAHAKPRFIAYFYATQLPQFTLLCMPVGLLLALLYSLTKMSRANEIIAMLTAGQSLVRLVMPLVAMGLLGCGICTFLSYKLAPHSESTKKELMALLSRSKNGDKKKKKTKTSPSQLFRNRQDLRTWFVERMPSNLEGQAIRLESVHIVQQDEEGNIHTKWYAKTAKYRADLKIWQMRSGKTVQLDNDGNILSDTSWPTLEIKNWSETPWRIASANVEPQSLSVPEIRRYLRYNADFPPAKLAPFRTYLQTRWAIPWECFVVVFIAAPMAIVYSRRGVLTGVATAIFCFAAMTFLKSLMLALGKGYRVSEFVSAWGPNLLFFVVGLVMLHARSNNRDLPKLSRLLRFR
jgi:LPS export ABC transporter permease LptG